MSDARVALVTGAARGIGAAIALELARSQLDVAILDVIDAGQTAAALEAAGRKALAIAGDVTSPADRSAALGKIEQTFGRLDVLVNNAGVAPTVRADILQATEESYDRVMNINLKGPYFLTQAAANWMIRQRSRRPDDWMCIVNISSMSAYTASTSRGEYCISKAGVSMTTKLWAARRRPTTSTTSSSRRDSRRSAAGAGRRTSPGPLPRARAGTCASPPARSSTWTAGST